MKKRITIALVLLVSSMCAWANPGEKPSFNCRTALADSNSKVSYDKQIEEDLLSGTWVQEGYHAGTRDEKLYFFQFNQFGAVDFLEFCKKSGASKHKTLSWRVELQYESPVLILRNKASGLEQAFEIEQTCKGIDLVNLLNGESKHLEYKPQLSIRKLAAIKAELAGEWGKSGISLENAGSVNLRYRFDSNGTYSKLLEGSQLSISEQGNWELSKDGQFLILTGTGAKRNSKNTEFIRIKFLQLDELVLEQKLEFESVGINVASTDYYFNKR